MVQRIRVLLADDHTFVLEGVRRVLEPECEIVGTVQDGRALVSATEDLKPDVVVVDISLPLLNGIDAARQIKKSRQYTKVVFLTMHTDLVYARQALEAGGSGFVLKTSAADELLTAIREAMLGRKFISSALSAPALESSVLSQVALDRPALTLRQREVLQLVAEGKTLKEIGNILHLSARTVEFHKYRIMTALGIRTTSELTQYAVKNGMVP